MTEKKLKRLPLGLSDFRKIIDGQYIYVDKTQLIHHMITSGDYYFLSRPRRFGKSLLIATLGELFSGNKELFNNLWIAKSDYTWQRHPVIRLDFSTIGSRTIPDLISNINVRLDTIAREYEIELSHYPTIDSKFESLIIQLSHSNKVVILIDEYDKPILDHIDNPAQAKKQREVLKSLYSVIKGSDQYLRFVLLTGVSKFAKTSIFSGINNLEDVTLDGEYATLLGYTKDELVKYFTSHIKLLAQKNEKIEQDIIDELENYYDGYVFAPQTEPVFNPYSVLSTLKKKVFAHYWFETGTPTFLIKLIKSGVYPLNRLYQPVMTADELGAFEPEDIKITALLYQSGYLTIKEYNQETKDYTLDFPNHEVARAFNLLIASSFTQLTYRQTKTYAARIAQAFSQQAPNELQQILQNLFNEMPYIARLF